MRFPRLAGWQETSRALREGWRFRRAVAQLTVRNLAQHTKGSVLGLGWLLLEPLFLFSVYTVVFGYLLKVRFDADSGIGHFALYLLAGLIPFDAFQQSVQRSTGVLTANRPLLIHARFPGNLLPLVEVLTGLVTETIGLGLLGLAVLGWGQGASVWWVSIPCLVLARLLMTLGVAWIASVLAVFVGDFAQLLRMVLTLCFFATPIIYPPTLIPAEWKWLEAGNPFYWLVTGYRAVFLEGAPPPEGFWWLLGGSALLAVLALIFFERALNRAKDFL
ncbi:ABC transporter permease [Methylohalobius crimeensis]|uniref:ABC transporter permease n=1 Tax=Methylohalobius crimeensis TaxID=244365 RepID=UPI0003B61282|nr:ABC transporter permease [Methylohalobius crimeensis]